MSAFQLGMLTGTLVTLLALPVAWLVVTDVRAWLRAERTRRAATAQHREDSRRFALAVSSAVTTPVPFPPLKTKGEF